MSRTSKESEKRRKSLIEESKALYRLTALALSSAANNALSLASDSDDPFTPPPPSVDPPRALGGSFIRLLEIDPVPTVWGGWEDEGGGGGPEPSFWPDDGALCFFDGDEEEGSEKQFPMAGYKSCS